MDEPELAGLLEAVEAAAIAWDDYTDASTPLAQAHTLARFDDTMTDLRSWHPRYSYEQGRIVPDQDEEELA